jgi:hypothetical protein
MHRWTVRLRRSRDSACGDQSTSPQLQDYFHLGVGSHVPSVHDAPPQGARSHVRQRGLAFEEPKCLKGVGLVRAPTRVAPGGNADDEPLFAKPQEGTARACLSLAGRASRERFACCGVPSLARRGTNGVPEQFRRANCHVSVGPHLLNPLAEPRSRCRRPPTQGERCVHRPGKSSPHADSAAALRGGRHARDARVRACARAAKLHPQR